KGSVKTTEEIKNSLTVGSKKEPNHRIPKHPGLNLPDINLPIDPYLYGYWLGDGCSADGSITVGYRDTIEVEQIFKKHSDRYNVSISDRKSGINIRFKQLDNKNKCLTHILKENNLINNKH